MTTNPHRPRFTGIIPPVVTPLMKDGALDAAGTERLIEHIVAGGCHGLFLLGSSGEATALSTDLRKAFVRRALSVSKGRLPTIVGVSSPSLAEAVAMAEFCAEAGADAAVSTAPFYLPLPQQDIHRFFQLLAKRSPLPLLLYNFPALVKSKLEPETVRQLADESNIIGIKDSSGDFAYFKQLIDATGHRAEWSNLTGSEFMLLESLLAGGHGGVCGGANFLPKPYVELFQAAIRKDLATAIPLQKRLSALGHAIYDLSTPMVGVIQGIKAMLDEMGICGPTLAEPCQALTADQRRELLHRLEAIGGLDSFPGA